MMYELGSKTPNPSGEVLAQSHLSSWLRIVAKTHKTLKEHFLIKQNRTKHANFEVMLFVKLHTIQQKTVKPTYLCPEDAVSCPFPSTSFLASNGQR